MYRFVTAVSILLLASPVVAQFDSESDGSDGPLNCETLGLTPCGLCTEQAPCEVQINLGLAASLCDCDGGGQLNDACDSSCPSPVPGQGVYDASEWAVVFKYTTIDIPEFVTVTFVNHPKGAPVVWLAMHDPNIMNDVTIAGTVSLNGANGSNDSNSPRAIPGPGGFSGGSVFLGGSAGFGPGGGGIGCAAGGGGYGCPGGGPLGGAMYGRDSIVPLIGGSGGGGSLCSSTGSGGAGGGAILIASSGDIAVSGEISANGGAHSGTANAGSGSGGGIRLIANRIWGPGLLRALGGTTGQFGGVGRIRVEANDFALDDSGIPAFTTGGPGLVFPGTPLDPAPILRVTRVNGKDVPADPLATVATGDVALTSAVSVPIDIEAQNVLLPATVTVRIVQADGDEVAVEMVALTGTPQMSTATVFFNFAPFDPGRWEVQLSVLRP